jgi:hypothetical protein
MLGKKTDMMVCWKIWGFWNSFSYKMLLKTCKIPCCAIILFKKVLEVLFLTRQKRLPVISREHFRKTRTNYFKKNLIWYLKYQSAKFGISNTKNTKRQLVFQIVIWRNERHLASFCWTWVTIHQEEQEQQSGYKSLGSTTCSRLKMAVILLLVSP